MHLIMNMRGELKVNAPGKDRDQLTLRITNDLKRKLTKQAVQTGVSVNALICTVLTEALKNKAS